MNEAELLFSDILKCDRASLYLNKDIRLDKNKSSLVSGVLRRRIAGEPIQYILGKAEFMGLEFKVTADVLIPRPETEILAEKAIEIAAISGARNILDIGTGSGCIAVSLAKSLPDAAITAVDISPAAIEIARHNARLNGTEDKIRFVCKDFFTAGESITGGFEVIVSNPPYIPTGDIDGLQPEIKYEPRTALDGGRDGLDFYRRIAGKTPLCLKERGFIIMEMGIGQKEGIKNIFQNSGYFEIIGFIRDYNNIDRIAIAKKRDTLSAKAKGVP